jgi:hypothetical protein
MKCSDCKLWQTNECKNNPDAEDWDNAETFSCFEVREGLKPTEVDSQDELAPSSQSSSPPINKTDRRLMIIAGVVAVIIAVGFTLFSLMFLAIDECTPH